MLLLLRPALRVLAGSRVMAGPGGALTVVFGGVLCLSGLRSRALRGRACLSRRAGGFPEGIKKSPGPGGAGLKLSTTLLKRLPIRSYSNAPNKLQLAGLLRLTCASSDHIRYRITKNQALNSIVANFAQPFAPQIGAKGPCFRHCGHF